MPDNRLAAIADRLVAARRQGARVALAGADVPKDYDEGFAIQDKVVAALASPVIGWKVMEVPGGPVIFAPILESGRLAPGGTWEVAGKEPAGIPLEAARKRRDEAVGLLREGVDPSTRKRQVKAARAEANANTFEVVADELLAKKKGSHFLQIVKEPMAEPEPVAAVE